MSSGSHTTEAPPREALRLQEGVSLLESATSSLVKPDGTRIELGYNARGELAEGGVFDSRGRVPLHIIRPGIGKGRGSHLYEAQMLEEHANVFSGWKMYLNHLSPEAKKASNGLPRDIRDTGGRVQESWWDPTVPANDERGHGQGAVVGMVRPVAFIRDLIDDDPELAEASIAASATAVHPVTRNGQRVWLVEGINPRGSVDWVTEAGAGGRIAVRLMEAYSTEEDVQMTLLESMSDDEVAALIATERPGVLAEAWQDMKKKFEKEDEEDDDDDDDKSKKSKFKPFEKKKTTKSALTEGGDNPEEGTVKDITPEALREALAASPELLVEAIVNSPETQAFLAALVEVAVDNEKEAILTESRNEVDRAFELAGLEREAHRLIAESKLPESWQADQRAKFSLVENAPTPALDVKAVFAADGTVEKSALAVLRESVTAEIEHDRGRLREASATRVRREQPAVPALKTPEGAEETREKSYWEQTLAEAGVPDPINAYGI